MAERIKVEMGLREGLLAIVFAALVLTIIAVAAAGYFSALLAGVLLTFTVVMIFLGDFLAKTGALSPGARPIWYVFTLGLALVLYGLVQRGVVPLAVAAGPAVMKRA